MYRTETPGDSGRWPRRVLPGTRAGDASGRDASLSRHHRNAASVLPEPVGARRSVWSPRDTASQPNSCARVGSAKVSWNHARAAGPKRPSAELCGAGGAVTRAIVSEQKRTEQVFCEGSSFRGAITASQQVSSVAFVPVCRFEPGRRVASVGRRGSPSLEEVG